MTEVSNYDLGYQDGAIGLAQNSSNEDYAKGYHDGRVKYLLWFAERSDD